MNLNFKKKIVAKFLETSNEEESKSENKIINNFNIKTIGNNIYFHEDIYSEEILELIQQITNLTYTLYGKSIEFSFEPHINLHIYSPGGDAFMGFHIYDFIKQNKVPIYTHINGNIASAATFMFLGGHKRFMTPCSTILIHQLSTGFLGKYEDLIDEYKNSSELMKIIKNLYAENTNMKKKELDTLLQRELFLGYNDCVKNGIIT